MQKQTLRTLYKQKRENLSAVQIKELENNIYKQLFKLDISAVKTAHIFLTLEKFKEINTTPIINYLRKKGIRIAVSKCNFKNNTLSHYYYEENTALILNRFGVPEPVNAEKAEESDFDLIFVPLLISDTANYRVGYGKGFYDRFLAKCRPDARCIGINFFEPISKIDDLNEFDFPLHTVIYPI